MIRGTTLFGAYSPQLCRHRPHMRERARPDHGGLSRRVLSWGRGTEIWGLVQLPLTFLLSSNEFLSYEGTRGNLQELSRNMREYEIVYLPAQAPSSQALALPLASTATWADTLVDRSRDGFGVGLLIELARSSTRCAPGLTRTIPFRRRFVSIALHCTMPRARRQSV
jgi:hypothetical protein